jgi:adenosylhomocysteinase
MDMSFALQALAAEHLVRAAGSLAAKVHPVPRDVDTEVARLKLAALGVTIDLETPEQERYRRAWR